jgi:hypothetical protein
MGKSIRSRAVATHIGLPKRKRTGAQRAKQRFQSG